MNKFNKNKKLEVDFLINNAGIAILEPFLETSDENWQKTMKSNLD